MSNQSTLSEFGVTDTDSKATENDSTDDKLYRDKEWLNKQYHECGKKIAEIAEDIDVHNSTIRRWMDKYDIERRYEDPKGNVVPLKNHDWIKKQYCESRRSVNDIADELGTTVDTVIKWMDKHGIERRSPAETQSDGNPVPLREADWLREQYHQQGKTTTEIAEELSVSQRAVWNWMERHDIDRRSMAEINTDGDVAPLRNAEWLREQYCGEGRSSPDIADELDVAPTTVRRWMEQHEIGRRDMSEAKAEGDVVPLKDPEWLHQRYVEQEQSAHDIADELGVSANVVRDWADKHGIQIRSLSEANAEGNVGPLRDSEWLQKQYCEQNQSIGKIGEKLGVSPQTVYNWIGRHEIELRPSRGSLIHPEHLEHPVRSDWELEIANWLIDHGIEYQYESMKIEYGDGRTYIPDFVTSDYVIEVKGQVFDDGNEEQKARAAMKALKNRDYVVVGTKLPADYHYSWDKRKKISSLLSLGSGPT
jgi:transposase-like protein